MLSNMDGTDWSTRLLCNDVQANLAMFGLNETFQDASGSELSYDGESESDCDDSSDKVPINFVCMAKISDSATTACMATQNEVSNLSSKSVENVAYAVCELNLPKIESLKLQNDNLLKEIVSLKDTYRQSLTSQINSREKIEALTISNHDLKAELSVKMTIDEQKFQEILKHRSKITVLENKVLELKNNLSKFRNSSFLINEIIEVSGKQKNSKRGIGFVEVPPPFHNDYKPNPFAKREEEIILKERVIPEKPKSVKVESAKPSIQKHHVESKKVFVENTDKVIIENVYEPEIVHKNKNIPSSNHILCEPHEFEEALYGSHTFSVKKEPVKVKTVEAKKSEKHKISDEDLLRFINPNVSKPSSIRVFKLRGIDTTFSEKDIPINIIKSEMIESVFHNETSKIRDLERQDACAKPSTSSDSLVKFVKSNGTDTLQSFSDCSNLDFYLKKKSVMSDDLGKNFTQTMSHQPSLATVFPKSQHKQVDTRMCFLCGQQGHVVRNYGQTKVQNIHPFIKNQSKPIPLIKEILKRPPSGIDDTHIMFSNVNPRKVIHVNETYGVVKPKFVTTAPIYKNVNTNVVQEAYLRRKSKRPTTYSQVAEQQKSAVQVNIS
ncbi:uncharacterized protein LOC143532882 [Bidens hawaiensis]|uniref:uncharacterized protein LOC143532882 n=1 Tax=Bidens hawaiensis TaxID=980011 RepID=UPI004049261E